MSDISKEIIRGIKTFFIVPEASLFPEDFLKTCCLRGYETYFLDVDPYCTLEKKIRTLFELFPQVILFFNIDRPLHGIEWPIFIGTLQREYGERAMIGVTYQKRNSAEEGRAIERLYLYTIGIVCGCIGIGFQKTKNVHVFLTVLAANQANGNRKSLRAFCDSGFKGQILLKGKTYHCSLRDISISHFSCTCSEDMPEIPLHEKIADIRLNLRGVLIKSDAVLCLKRVLEDEMISVFVFRTADGREGLDVDVQNKVNDLIFTSMNEGIQALLSPYFRPVKGSTVVSAHTSTPPLLVSEKPENTSKDEGMLQCMEVIN